MSAGVAWFGVSFRPRDDNGIGVCDSRSWSRYAPVSALHDEPPERRETRLVSSQVAPRMDEVIMEADLRDRAEVMVRDRESDPPAGAPDTRLYCRQLSHPRCRPELSQ